MSVRVRLAVAALAALALAGCTRAKEVSSKDAGTTAATTATPGDKTGAARPAQPEKKELPAPPDVAAAPADAQKTASGLASKILQPGTGTATPATHDRVEVNYTGWTTDGKMFDSSVARGRPATFQLRAVIPGWTEGLGLMVEGEKRRLWIPEELAYKGREGAPQGMLVFDVELLKIHEGPKPIPAPEDVAAAPADAKKTKTGIAYKVLTKGDGKDQPTEDDRVKVNYTGWTTDGEMFDSSVMRNRPASFPLKGVIPGWTEGLQLMKTGDKFRFWIPEELAYKGKPGAPQGMLVFDVELLEVVKPPKPIPAPKDVAAAPKGAQKTASGIHYTVLSKGKGEGENPTAASKVTVHYTGWTTDGKMFDSSVMRGRPATFPLGGVIKGWTEGVQLMKVGDKFRFWIPDELAYKGKPGRPQGTLVFDIELVSIEGK